MGGSGGLTWTCLSHGSWAFLALVALPDPSNMIIEQALTEGVQLTPGAPTRLPDPNSKVSWS